MHDTSLLTKRQLEVFTLIEERGPLTTKEICEAVYGYEHTQAELVAIRVFLWGLRRKMGRDVFVTERTSDRWRTLSYRVKKSEDGLYAHTAPA